MGGANESSDKGPRDEALAWFVKLNSGEATPQDHADHAAWLDACQANRREFEELQNLWGDLDAMGDPRDALPGTAAGPSHALMSRRSFIAGGVIAASAAGYVAISGLPQGMFSDYYTGTGELRDVTLPDGSTLTLDADTAIELDFGTAARRVHLQKGRAFFDVAADASRPFSVRAASGEVRALGTQFIVQRWDAAVDVSVVEHAVAITAPDAAQAELGAGERASYGATGLAPVIAGDIGQATAWRTGRLVFDNKPLWQVVADVNRYRAGTIYIVDDSLNDLRVSGVFDIANPDGVLAAITNTLDLGTTALTRYVVLLHGTT